MLLPLSWLKEYLQKPEINIDLEALAENLNMLGLEVEAVHGSHRALENVVVGRIEKIERHPNADRLQVTQVLVSNEANAPTRQIVCGAKNIAEGDIVPVALPGAVLPGNFNIKMSSIRGVESSGMLCSAKELGVSEESEGILKLPRTAVLGALVSHLIGGTKDIEDSVLEIGLTPNRGDCLSMIGLAREIAPLLKTKLKEPKPIKFRVSPHRTSSIIKIEVQDPNLCPRYVGRIVDGLKVTDSPKWIQDRLKSVGINPINNIVDVTNYVMLEYGIPLHAFDLRRIESGNIQVGTCAEAMPFTLLNGDTVQVQPGDILIKDGEKPIALAGIMGGENSQIKEDTTSILLEAACFLAPQVRLTAKRLGLSSESSKRFERGVDIGAVAAANERAAGMLRDLYNANVYHPGIDTHEEAGKERPIAVDMRDVRRTIGVNFPVDYVCDVLESIQIPCLRKSSNILIVKLPSFRNDLTESVDVIEEIARLAGYDRIPQRYPVLESSYHIEPRDGFSDVLEVKKYFSSVGFHETVHYSFGSESQFAKFGFLRNEKLEVQNPINEDLRVLRYSLFPSLCSTYVYNFHRKKENQWLFEIGKHFNPDSDSETGVRETRVLGGLMSGFVMSQWDGAKREVDFFYAKGLLENFFQRFTHRHVEFSVLKDHPVLHPGKAAEIRFEGRHLGVLGEVHPYAKKFLLETNENVVLFEVNLEEVFTLFNNHFKFKSISKFPPVRFDVAFLVDRNTTSEAIYQVIEKAAGPLLHNLEVFDHYLGDKVPSDKKSLAFRLVLQSQEKTLTEQEVHQVTDKVIAQVSQQFGAELRA